MNIQKLIAIVVALAINVLALAWFHAWTNTLAAEAAAAAMQSDKVRVLPVIEVRPTAAQWRALRPGSSAPAASRAGDARLACIDMPYYSFAAPCAGVVDG